MTASAASISASTSACRTRPLPMKPTLQVRLSQHLTLTPQLQQSIRLLQLSTVELNQEIERMLAENPILEREDAESEAPAPHTVSGAASTSSPEPAAGDDAPPEREDDWLPELGAPGWRGEGEDDGDRTFAAPDTPTIW